ncbi:PAS domain S-box protein [Oscillatoria sp. FACHB-1407]|uniref:PAS domain S-box protein n=1 Tax=Oscillatoria sp. FACHB-1407 TaxID=2692847 RepID=UPI0016825C9B|nr:PAS domain S-box protein [Oscillatoria sp. FACHB-1407]MBD2463471.1 PAS domain S-box protein [Oscillatoria sp. FACHB-1407]
MVNKTCYTVLIVDDSPEDREVYRRYLNRDDRHTYEITETASVSSALALCDRSLPDLILLDYRLPDDDGLMFLQEWQVRYEKILAPVIMLTGQGDEQIAVETIRLGGQDYLTKGKLTTDSLCQKVHQVLEQVRLKQQISFQQEQQRLVNSVALRIRRSLQLDDVLQTTVDEVHQLLQCDRALIYKFAPDRSGTITHESVLPPWRACIETQIEDTCFKNNGTDKYTQGWIWAEPDVANAKLTDCHLQLLESFQVKANLVVPILLETGKRSNPDSNSNHQPLLWGLLAIHQCDRPRQWQKTEIDLVNQLAVQLAIAIQQAELYQNLQTLNSSLEKQVEQRTRALAASEQRFRGIFDNAFQFVGLLTPEGILLEANQTALDFAGLQRDDVINRPFWEMDWWAISSEIQTQLQQAIAQAAQGEFVRYEMDLIGKAGIITTVDFSLRPLCNEEGEVVLLIPEGRDISDRKRNESTLQLQAQILNQIHDAVISTTLDGTIQTWNSAAEKLYGYTAEEAIGQNVSILYLPEDLPQIATTVFQPLLTVGSHQVELRNQTKSGTQIDISLRLSVVYDDMKHPIRLIGCSNDISDRKQAAKALQESQTLLRSVIDNLPQAIFWKDRESRFLGCNQQMLLDAGFSSAEDIIGKTDFDLPWREEAPLFRADDRQVIESGQPKLNIEEPLTKVGNIHSWLKTNKLPLRSADGSIIGVLGSYEDITERKRIEHALQESERRYATLAATAPVGIYRTDADGNCLYVNDRWCELAGLTPEEAAGFGWIQGLHPDDREMISAEWYRCARTGEVFRLEYRFQRPDGITTWVYGQATQEKKSDGGVIGYIGTITDISDRKAVEQELQSLNQELEARVTQRTAELQESQQFIQSVTDSIPNVLYIYDLERNCNVYANQELTIALGYTPKEIHEMGATLFSNLMHPEDLEKFIFYLQDLKNLEGQEKRTIEYRLLNPKGEWRWYLSQDTSFRRGVDGQVQQVIGTAQDITARKQIEEQLYRSEAQLRTAQRIAGFGSWEFDVQTGVVTWSEEVFDIFGRNVEDGAYSYEELHAAIHPNDRDHHRSLTQQAIEYGHPYTVEFRFYRHGGDLRYVHARGEAILGSNGQPIQLLGTVLDITERKQSEEQLRHLSERLTIALQSGGFGSWEYDFVRSQQLWDDRMYELYGVTPDNFAGTLDAWLGYLHPDDRESMLNQIQEVLDNQSEYSAEFRIIHPTGAVHHLKAYGILQRNEQQEPVRMIGINYDITDFKLAEEQLRQINNRLTLTNAELHRATRLKDEFLANMSHELRTPLNAILGMAESLQDEILGVINPHQKDAISSIERSGQHLLELINDILDLAKVESGKLELQLCPVKINHLCISSLNFVRQQAFAKNIQITTELPSDLPAIILDELRIRQVLINLLSNAVKFTPNGGSIKLAVHQEQSQGQPLLCFQITDTGIGIALDDMCKLFQPFTQVDSQLNRKHMGTGLGLALVRRLVELHQGQITVASEVGRGSCFTVCLPYKTESSAFVTPAHDKQSFASATKEQDASLPSNQASNITSTYTPTKSLILLVEDNEANAATISNYLEGRGYQLLRASNGQEAITLATTQHPNLILMDVQMPDIDGLEAIARIRTYPQLAHTPIIAVTALAMTGDREKCLAAGANDYMTKPIKLKQLVNVIRGWLQ